MMMSRLRWRDSGEMTLAAPWKRCAWWGPEDGDSERQGVLSCFLLCCLGLRYQQMLRRTSNPSVNSNKLGNGAMDPTDIAGSIREKISAGRGLLMMQAQEYPLSTCPSVATEESSSVLVITEMTPQITTFYLDNSI